MYCTGAMGGVAESEVRGGCLKERHHINRILA